jgi:host factor-I protein
MNKAAVNLQDTFLNLCRKESVPVTIYLIGGVQLRGLVRGFDTFTILLEGQGRPGQLVYKSAITSIVPLRPVHLRDAHEAARPAEREDAHGGNGQAGEPLADAEEMRQEVTA